MEKSNEMFELMTKIYAEVQGIKLEMNDMKSEMNDMKSEMKDMKSEMKDMKKEQSKTNERLDKLENRVDEGFNEVNKRFDEMSGAIGHMVTNEIAEELSNKLKEIKTDVKFVKRKVQDTEEDVFVIQDVLKIIK